MDKIGDKDILEGLKDGDFEPSYILKLIETDQLTVSDYDIEEIVEVLKKDEDKIALMKYTYSPLRIIKTLENEDSVVKALDELNRDEEKLRAALLFIKSEENRLKAIEKMEDKDKAFFIKISLSKENLKKYFLREEDKKYSKIGLDKDITIGIEIESVGNNSREIMEAGRKNGTIFRDEKGIEIECGRIVKRRKRRK